MKADRKFIVILSSLLLAFFLIALAGYIFYGYDYFIYNMNEIFFALLIVFAVAAGAIIVYLLSPFLRKKHHGTQNITKIALLSDANIAVEEFSLLNRTSALICFNDSACFRTEDDQTGEVCVLLNCVDSFWYAERVTDERSVGIKRAAEQYVCKLKSGMCYRLQINDIIYIDKERMLMT
ncbi:MAG: hypothetical protein FWG61_07860 [Firmicutes bacterium]|nr:hypothetical protein [Bacillota bacterium]